MYFKKRRSSMRWNIAIVSLGLSLLAATVHAQFRTPSAAVAYFDDGNKKVEKGDFDGAIQDFTLAIQLSSNLLSRKGPRANSWRDEKDLRDESDRISVIDPFTANAYSNRCLARYKKQEYETALADCNRALKINPGLPAAYLNRGAARRLVGDRGGAMSDFNRALAIDSTLFEAYNNRGTLRYELGDREGAIADLNHCIKLKPSVADAYYHRGYIRLEKREYQEAITDFNRAIQLNPRMASAYQGRGTA